MLRCVATALLLTASASAAAIGGACQAPAPDTSSKCSSYTLINARGTSEKQGTSVGFKQLDENLLSEKKGGNIYNVVYDATWDQNSGPGTTDLINQVGKLLEKNPSECFALQGYSQGATVVVDALRNLTGPAFDAVKGVILFGNTEHKPNLKCNLDIDGGTKTLGTTGVLYSAGKGIPDDWVSKTLDFCNVGDSICDRSVLEDGDGDLIRPAHLAYPGSENVISMSNKFLLDRLNE